MCIRDRFFAVPTLGDRILPSVFRAFGVFADPFISVFFCFGGRQIYLLTADLVRVLLLPPISLDVYKRQDRAFHDLRIASFAKNEYFSKRFHGACLKERALPHCLCIGLIILHGAEGRKRNVYL